MRRIYHSQSGTNRGQGSKRRSYLTFLTFLPDIHRVWNIGQALGRVSVDLHSGCYCHHFTDEATEAEGSKELAQDYTARNGGTEAQI